MPEPAENAAKTVPGKKRRSWLRFSLKSLMVLLTLVCVVLGGKLQYDWYKKKWLVAEWVRPVAEDARQSKDGMSRLSANSVYGGPLIPDPPEGVRPEYETQLLAFGVLELDTSIERYSALYLLVETHQKESLSVIWSLIPRCRYPDLQAMLLHFVSLSQIPEDIPRIEPYLLSNSAEVRAAAAESIGFIHASSYGFPYDFGGSGYVQLHTVPSIDASFLINEHKFVDEAYEDDRQARIPSETRESLERMMMYGPTLEERTAAARALVAWPPKQYSLRLAEWGIWLDDHGKLSLAKSVLEEIPPFVHQLGNSSDTLPLNRFNGPLVISKPIIHLTADHPLAVDLDVAISLGRPWCAYPRPDDLTVRWDRPYAERQTLPISYAFDLPELSTDDLNLLEPREMSLLEPLSEGYPWLHPSYRRGGHLNDLNMVKDWIDFLNRDNKTKEGAVPKETGITSLGLVWQSLIVAPSQEPWMTLAEVPAANDYRWWSGLRDVPSSWVTSQGETERFLYYDGPTLAKPPLTARLQDGELKLKTQDMLQIHFRNGDPQPEPAQNRPRDRDCLYVDVATGQPRAIRFQLSSKAGVEDARKLADQTWLTGDRVEQALLDILLRRGLTKAEANGLIVSWREKFFQTPGWRLLTFLTPAEYDRMCPLEIRPETTEQVRVGIVLTEF